MTNSGIPLPLLLPTHAAFLTLSFTLFPVLSYVLLHLLDILYSGTNISSHDYPCIFCQKCHVSCKTCFQVVGVYPCHLRDVF
ncbi:hypothetical protein B0H10DRAFT_2003127 [Mycena sp. CBHHK59/15]|nr:hypothetical protein B0H10DRAFT_2003127 [Mycena sp. CBHHK59/15]